MISEKLNSYFTEVTEDLLSQASSHYPQQLLKLQANNCPVTIFIAPVTENEVIRVIKDLKNQFFSRFRRDSNISGETVPIPLHKATGPHLQHFLPNRYFPRHDETGKSKTTI